jgi:hypothetical protein
MSYIATGVTTLASGALGAFITNALSRGRAIDEKLWELRRTAYSGILTELLNVERILDSAADYIAEDAMRYFHSETFASHNERISKSMTKVWELHASNYLILSEPFLEAIERLFDRLNNVDPNRMPDEEHELFEAAIRAERPKLLEQAKGEMPIRRTWRHHLRRLRRRKQVAGNQLGQL